jgi:hypothetical protein
MKTLITDVTVQVSEDMRHFTVFVTYKRNNTEYFGFTPFDNVLDAIEYAEETTKMWDAEFMSVVTGYNFKTLLNGYEPENEFCLTKKN